jgi:hypothetical protein
MNAAAGAAAGLAAAFNTPLAAVTIGLEEIIVDLNSALLGSVLLASVIGGLWCTGFPFFVRLPTLCGIIVAGISNVKAPTMNHLSLLTLLLFFVLQALIYMACLFKLAEIRRQNLPSRVKLKLLENEDHLFDAGLYLGFAGMIISLILVSLGVIQPSLMAAYSSTSFGIIFVSVFKIFHVRPARRTLLLDDE